VVEQHLKHAIPIGEFLPNRVESLLGDARVLLEGEVFGSGIVRAVFGSYAAGKRRDRP